MNKQNRPELNDFERDQPYVEYYNRKPASVPQQVINDIQNGPYPSEKSLSFEHINDLLNPGYLSLENGFCHMPDGSFFVAVLTEMPKVTGDMVDWWFWWHPINALR